MALATEPVIHAVDDDRRFLAALARTLRSTGLDVRAYTHPATLLDELHPDQPGCLVTDLRLPDMDGLALQGELAQRHIRLPVVFITGHGDASNAVAALKHGAVDFLEKPFSEQTLLASVQQALDKDATDRRLASRQAIVLQRYEQLTPREQEIYALVVSDLPNKEIARQLRISPRTVEHHREHVMLKMQARSMAELVTMAILCGLHELSLGSH